MTALCAATLLSGCSGDDGSDGDAKPSPTAGASDEVVGHSNKSCKTEVEVSGATSASWSGKGDARVTDGDLAVYTSEDGANRLTVYSVEGDIPASVNLVMDAASYTSPVGDDTGLTVEASGKSAEVDADLEDSADGEPVHVTATFTCKKG